MGTECRQLRLRDSFTDPALAGTSNGATFHYFRLDAIQEMCLREKGTEGVRRGLREGAGEEGV